MGLGDIVSRILLEVKADTSDAKAKLRDLSGEEKKLAEQRVAGMEAGNKSIDKYVKNLAQVGIALGVAKAGVEAFNFHAQKAKLESASAGVSIEGLSRASHGLRTNMDLLSDAAFLNKTAFHATQQQMQQAEGALFALTERGNDSNEVWNAMKEALSKGATEPLEKFGITIKTTGLEFDAHGNKLDDFAKKQEKVRRLYEALGKVATEAGGEQDSAIMKTEQGMVRLQNAWDDAKDKVGEVVAAIGGPLMTALANSIARTMKLIDMLPKGPGGKSLLTYMPGLEGLNELDEFDKSNNRTGTAAVSGFRGALSRYQVEQESRPDYFAASLGPGTVDPAGVQKGLTALYDFAVKFSKYDPQSTFGQFANLRGYGAATQGRGGGALGQAANSNYLDAYGAEVSLDSIIGGIGKERDAALTSDWFKRLNEQRSKKDKFLESTFGPIEDFNAYAQGFQMLSGAVTTAMDAWIDGSLSAGAAIKKFLAEAIKGVANQMAVEALKHGAYAIGSLAFGDIAGAGRHAAAAAAFTLGAGAAAVAAKELGSGGAKVVAPASGGAGASGGSSSGGGSGSGSSGQNQYIIVYSEPFVSESNRMRQLDADRLVRRALGNSSAENS